MEKNILHLLLLITSIILTYHTINSCSCLQGTIEEEVENTPVIFIGRVINIQKRQDFIGVTFRVGYVFKGPRNRIIRVRTALNSAMCGYNFIRGRTYLVYANVNDRVVSVSLCSRTKLFSAARDDIKYLSRNR